jgi:PPK2 family polyphosphate:nucleotide phosphotransferase
MRDPYRSRLVTSDRDLDLQRPPVGLRAGALHRGLGLGGEGAVRCGGVETNGLVRSLRVEPGTAAALTGRDPGSRLGLGDRQAGLQRLGELVVQLGLLHNRLWAEARRSLLLVLQGLDASGKDGTIRHVLTGVNPQGCRIVSFKEPSAMELTHDYLWRVHAACPARGELGIFNRSHYEDAVTVRVRGLVPESVWTRRPHHIREFERLLTDEGTRVVKAFLHVSKGEQRKRLQERLDDPEKAWKFRRGDLDDRARWSEYMDAYEDVITSTSTEWAPWYVIPADHNWVRNLAVAEILVHTLSELDPQFPAPDPSLAGLRIS